MLTHRARIYMSRYQGKIVMRSHVKKWGNSAAIRLPGGTRAVGGVV
jgi:putative transposon-encoded protein